MIQRAQPPTGSRRLGRRMILGLFAGAGATGLLAACGRGTTATTASTQVPPATTPQAPPGKQTVTGSATPIASPAASPPAGS